MLRSNHSTWPVDVSQIKQGFIMVKGHSTVSLQLTSLPFPFTYVPPLFPIPGAAQVAVLASCPLGLGSQIDLHLWGSACVAALHGLVFSLAPIHSVFHTHTQINCGSAQLTVILI